MGGMISFDHAALVPLSTDALIEERVTELVGRAVRWQLWIMFLDRNGVQLPVLMPFDDLPLAAPDGVTMPIGDFADSVGATSVFAVLERYDGAALTANDVGWARLVRDSCAAASVVLRGVLLSHKRGVRWIALDEYV
jgi:hypothetical protein